MRIDRIADSIIKWLQEFSRGSRTDGYVLGLSGGIDSAVVIALCERAMPGKTLGVIMPCHSNAQDAEDAEVVASVVGCQTVEVDLSHTYDILLGSAHEALSIEEPARMALANIKPRLRMTTVYYYANQLNRLVVGTSNKDERYVGYFTKWGDGAADVLPIAGLLKSEVRDLAAYLGIPDRVITKPPSGGLWANQTDEREMGLTYAELDLYLSGGQVTNSTMEKIERMHRKSKHKLIVPPIWRGDD